MARTTVNKRFWNCWNRPPIPDNHPEITQQWLHRVDQQLSSVHLLKKTLSRLLFLYFTWQQRYWLDVIPRATKRILWLHISDNLGDSLMRLAPIQLLKNFSVDLYSTGAATQLFANNSYFHQVYNMDSDESVVAANQYDLIVIDALQTKPLKKKIAVAKNTPFITLHELFHFCRDDYNPTYYTWWRIQYLLRLFEESKLEPHVIMDVSETAKQKAAALNIPKNSIAIVVGGREAYRTYQHWDEVVAGLRAKNSEQTIILLGSDNGRDMAQKISEKYKVMNCVAQYSLLDTAAIIQQCALLICADGGLLHVANAVNTPTLSLFAQEYPELRYVAEDSYQALRAEEDVNQILPENIVEMVNQNE